MCLKMSFVFAMVMICTLQGSVASFERLDKRSEETVVPVSDKDLAEFEKVVQSGDDSGVIEHKEIKTKRFEPFSNGDRYFGEKRFDPMYKRFEPFSDYSVVDKKFDPYSKRFDPYSKRFDPYSKRFDPYSKRFDPLSKRFDPFTKRFDPFNKKFDPLMKKSSSDGEMVRKYWMHLGQNKRNIIDPQAYLIGFGRR